MTVWTVRLALLCYVAALTIVLRRSSEGAWRFGGMVWMLGSVLLWAHLAAAFHEHHHWSHAHAAAETSRRTAALVGWSWGGEIYWNYVFAVVWSIDAFIWRLAPNASRRRPVAILAAIHAFMFFIVLNATVVFAEGAMRAAGIIGGAWLAAMLFARWRSCRISQASPIRID